MIGTAPKIIEKLPSGESFAMIEVKGGTFTMGDDHGEFNDEKPAHPVQLDDFYLGEYVVTQGLWMAVMGPDHNPSYYTGENRPVETVSWEDAQSFIQKLNNITRKKYRLPTEAEWEYAARGGTYSRGTTYAGSDHLKEVGWYTTNSHRETKDVGQKLPNELGLYDMSGNVWEWCQDWYDKNYYEKCKKEGTVVNPQGPDRGTYRVIRGGSWGHDPESCRGTSRDCWPPEDRDSDVGFRLAWSPS